jgi:dienelactone hydrolase
MARGRAAGLCAVAVLVACGIPAAPPAAPAPPLPAAPTVVVVTAGTETWTETWREVPAPPKGEAAAAAGARWIEVVGPDEGRQLAAVFWPRGPGPSPVVVYLPGGSGLTRLMLAWAPQLAAAGFLTVAGCWRPVIAAAGAAANVIDCPSAPVQGGVQGLVAAARALPGARAAAVGLLGLSEGAAAALLVAGTSEGVKAAAADSGAPRWDPADRPPRAAVLLLAGEGETGPNRQYAERLRQLGTPVEEAYYPRGGHVVTLGPQAEGLSLGS